VDMGEKLAKNRFSPRPTLFFWGASCEGHSCDIHTPTPTPTHPHMYTYMYVCPIHAHTHIRMPLSSPPSIPRCKGELRTQTRVGVLYYRAFTNQARDDGFFVGLVLFCFFGGGGIKRANGTEDLSCFSLAEI
jgi:hypothetical protein